LITPVSKNTYSMRCYISKSRERLPIETSIFDWGTFGLPESSIVAMSLASSIGSWSGHSDRTTETGDGA
jgi:hypothetical protein